MRLPSVDRLTTSLANGWDFFYFGEIADLRPTPSRIIHEGPQRATHAFNSARPPRSDRSRSSSCRPAAACPCSPSPASNDLLAPRDACFALEDLLVKSSEIRPRPPAAATWASSPGAPRARPPGPRSTSSSPTTSPAPGSRTRCSSATRPGRSDGPARSWPAPGRWSPPRHRRRRRRPPTPISPGRPGGPEASRRRR
jgi:hypothetical protein